MNRNEEKFARYGYCFEDQHANGVPRKGDSESNACNQLLTFLVTAEHSPAHFNESHGCHGSSLSLPQPEGKYYFDGK